MIHIDALLDHPQFLIYPYSSQIGRALHAFIHLSHHAHPSLFIRWFPPLLVGSIIECMVSIMSIHSGTKNLPVGIEIDLLVEYWYVVGMWRWENIRTPELLYTSIQFQTVLIFLWVSMFLRGILTLLDLNGIETKLSSSIKNTHVKSSLQEWYVKLFLVKEYRKPLLIYVSSTHVIPRVLVITTRAHSQQMVLISVHVLIQT